MLSRTIRLTGEEYSKVVAIQNDKEARSGQRPSFSEVIGDAVRQLPAHQNPASRKEGANEQDHEEQPKPA